MRSRSLFVLLILVFTACSLAGNAAIPQPNITGSARITGRVVDEAGRPITGAMVRAGKTLARGNLLSRAALKNSSVTGSDGRYEISGLATGSHILRLIEPSDRLAKSTVVRVTNDAETEAPDIVAASGVTVSGQVVDADTGEPIRPEVYWKSQGLHLSVADATGNPRQMYTDENGSFSVRALPGKVRIEYITGNRMYLNQPEGVALDVEEGGLSGVSIKVKMADLLKGVVVDAQGLPVNRASVAYDDGKTRMSMDTGKSGIFEFVVPHRDDPIEAKLRAITRDRALGIVISVPRSTLEADGFRLILQQTRTLSVAVKDEKGRPVKGAYVSGRPESLNFHAESIAPPLTQTGPDGRVVLAGAVVGDTFRVRVARQGIYLNKDVVLPKVAGPEWKDRVTVVVQTANRALIGKVLDPQGNPVAYASVSTSTQATTSTDANGDFVLRYLPEDKIWVQASKGRLRGYATTDATAKELTIKLSPARFVIM